MKAYAFLLLALLFGAVSAAPSAYAEQAVDPSATNPTNADQISFSKTIMSHSFERTLHSHSRGPAPLTDPTGITGGRWGATGDEPVVFRAAAAAGTGRGWGWIGLLGLFGLLGLRRRAERS